MKKIKFLSLLLALLFILSSFAACGFKTNTNNLETYSENLNDENVENPDFMYEMLDDGTYSVKIKSTSTATSLTIPTTYEEKPVTKFCGFEEYGFPTPLTDLTIPKEIKEIDCKKQALYYGDSALTNLNIHIQDLLSWCQAKITLPYEFENLYVNGQRISGRLIIPEGVSVLKEGAFSFNIPIFSITLPSTLTKIEEGSINNVNIYEVINYSSLNIKEGYKNNGGIAENAFYVHKGKNSKIDFVDDFIFLNHRKGTNGSLYEEYICIAYLGEKNEIVFPEREKNYSIGHAKNYSSEGLTTYGDKSRFTSIKLNNCITEIRYFAFRDFANIASITIPKSICFIDVGAFYGCDKLESAFFENQKGWKYEHYLDHEDYSGSLDYKIGDEVGMAHNLTRSNYDNKWSMNCYKLY